MKKILWIVQGVGWGWDTRAKVISKILFMYEHIMMPTFTFKDIANKIEECKPDIVMVMWPSFLSHLTDYNNKIVATLPSFGGIGIKEWYE